jgi:hypothetical protein
MLTLGAIAWVTTPALLVRIKASCVLLTAA